MEEKIVVLSCCALLCIAVIAICLKAIRKLKKELIQLTQMDKNNSFLTIKIYRAEDAKKRLAYAYSCHAVVNLGHEGLIHNVISHFEWSSNRSINAVIKESAEESLILSKKISEKFNLKLQ